MPVGVLLVGMRHTQHRGLVKWFAGDFKQQSGSIVKFVQRYRPDLPEGKWKLRYTDYNWSLNDSSARR